MNVRGIIKDAFKVIIQDAAMKPVLLLCACVASLTSIGSAFAADRPPNIVFIMADDLGPGWVDYDGSNPDLNTPNLQRLANEGMTFTKAYAAAPVCSPTRAACITGLAPARIGLTTHVPGKAGNERPGPKGGPREADSLNHLPLDLPSYARELKLLGYATGFIGKWHLAGEGSIGTPDGIVNRDYHPERFGFDVNVGGCAYGQPRSWFAPYHNGTIADRKPGEYLTDRLGDEAAAFINDHRDRPFHLTLWPYSVHTPIKAPRDLVAKNGGDAYRAMVESLDGAVGKVLDALEATGNADRTLVVFYSDNGGHIPTEGLADKKASLLEGGLRVPMVVRWPGVIEPGTTCAVPVTSMDFFPTFVQASGGVPPETVPLDGVDLAPLFRGANRLERDALYWHFPHNRMEVSHYMGSVILEDEWKFYLGHGLIKNKLFNLQTDPGETRDVSAEFPDRAERMRHKLERWLAETSAKMPKSPRQTR
ncbi:Choline-sulfatase [Planctomycetes bacterium LzC2]|uniref:Choline-sulfatase n=1 Tax=Alienimonas chondri TaxID=2681879 RepID=A0ABX1VI74_9PLAN|nr:Choline-sulfatase [Alienimonas chondri]